MRAAVPQDPEVTLAPALFVSVRSTLSGSDDIGPAFVTVFDPASRNMHPEYGDPGVRGAIERSFYGQVPWHF